MSAELHWFYEDGGVQDRSQELADGEIAWANGYGDGQGNETCILAQDGEVQIFRGTVETTTHEGEQHMDISRLDDDSSSTKLRVGELRVERLQNRQGRIILLHVMNLGEGPATHPGMRPAWN